MHYLFKVTNHWCHTLHRLFKEADAVLGKFAYLKMYAVSITRAQSNFRAANELKNNRN